MKLELNTNGAWRTVLRHLDAQATEQAREAAATLSRLDDRRKPVTWRLASEADDTPVASCCGAGGWQSALRKFP